MSLASDTASLRPDMTPDARRTVAFSPYVATVEDGRNTVHMLVEGIHCGGCVAKIERALNGRPGVEARVNLTTKRLAVTWHGPADEADDLAALVESLGYRVLPFAPEQAQSLEQAAEKELLRCLAVAGFAAANVMLLSVAIWAGHVNDEMGAATRTLLYWFSALIAAPAIVFAGWPFYRSALRALLAGHTNMDVPISLGVLLATGMSLAETIRGGPHAYFESAVMLLFFLLVGRYLDRRARGRARSAAERLLALNAVAVTVVEPDGSMRAVPPDQVAPDATVLIAAGDRVGIDGTINDGRSELDTAMITGESIPSAVGPGDAVYAGTVNLTGPLTVRVTAAGRNTLLSDIVSLMEAAEQRRGRYVALADRVARAYAPVVHGLSLATFLGWWLLVGAAWQQALLIAIAVLIITCPCALGLAVPAVQVIASGRLMRRGILLKSASALERLRTVDMVIFDKTGTLTEGRPRLANTGPAIAEALPQAAALACTSRHPLARALAAAAPATAPATGVEEVPGRGLRRRAADGETRLGSRDWCGVDASAGETAEGPELWFTRPGAPAVQFRFVDAPRSDAAEVVAALAARGLEIALLSGDRPQAVASLASTVGITDWHAGLTPADKVAYLEARAAEGRAVLMVGDGLNDAPALAAAAASMSPTTASDITQTAADVVFQGRRLAPVVEAVTVADRANRLVFQNFAMSLAYNLVTIPVAVFGLVTPLIAAAAMSASSIAVVTNSLRLARGRR